MSTPEADLVGAPSTPEDGSRGAMLVGTPARQSPLRLDRLFVPAPDRPVRRGAVLLAVAALVAGTAVSLSRVRGRGVFDTMFGEDGSLFLNDAWTSGLLHSLLRPYNGYVHVVPRLLAEIAAVFPASWAPGVMSIEAGLIGCALALVVYLASAGHLRHPLARLVISVPAALVPTAHGLLGGESGPVDNNIATLQFPALYATFWVLLWLPARRWGRAAAVAVALGTTLSSILPVIFLPLAVARLLVRRDRASLTLVGAFCTGILVQLLGILTNLHSRDGVSHPRPDASWVLAEYLRTAVPNALFGEVWLSPPSPHRWEQFAVVALAWLIVLTAVAVALVKLTSPATVLAVVAGGYSLLLFGFEIGAHGSVPARYVTAPALLVLTAVVALLRPGLRPGGTDLVPLVSLATLVAVVCVVNLRVDSYRSTAPSWREAVSRAAAQCAAGEYPSMPPPLAGSHGPNAYVDYAGPGWTIHIPCGKLR